MIVYSSTITPRLLYILDFVGKELIGQAFQLTDKKDEFLGFAGPGINYSAGKIKDNEFWLPPHSLLFEKEIKGQDISCFEVNNHKAFFKTSGDFPFDIFAASFYLLSRYEEYLSHKKDVYGRYAHENSLAFKENFLDKPLVNSWLEDLRSEIVRKFPSFTIHHSPFTFLPTYDIDEAYSFKHKQWWRTIGGTIKELLKGEFKKLAVRRKVLKNELSDPFDSYAWMDQLHRQYKLHPRYFFLVAGHTGKYDRNILPGEEALQQIIKQHASQYEVGIHPSWQSGDDPELISKELATLSAITGKKITSSRQHYIRFTLPQPFRLLIKAGITEDFSMGYGSINGFRASVATPFYWYDLEKEVQTGLLLYPFCFMEANSFFEQKFTPQEALEEMRNYYTAIKAVNGTFITIWHNTFLGTSGLFAGWREVYAQFLKEIKGSRT